MPGQPGDLGLQIRRLNQGSCEQCSLKRHRRCTSTYSQCRCCSPRCCVEQRHARNLIPGCGKTSAEVVTHVFAPGQVLRKQRQIPWKRTTRCTTTPFCESTRAFRLLWDVNSEGSGLLTLSSSTPPSAQNILGPSSMPSCLRLSVPPPASGPPTGQLFRVWLYWYMVFF